MSEDDKMWYSMQEAMQYLAIEEYTLSKLMYALNIETHPLPNAKGQFISTHDVLELEKSVKIKNMGVKGNESLRLNSKTKG